MDIGFYVSNAPGAIASQRFYIEIKINNCSIFRDNLLAELLDMDYNHYINLLESFGAENSSVRYMFKNKASGQKLVDHLNNKYLVVLKLTGKI